MAMKWDKGKTFYIVFAFVFLSTCVLPLFGIYSFGINGGVVDEVLHRIGRVLSLIDVSVFFMLIVVEIVSLFFDKGASIKTLFITIALFFYSLTTYDSLDFLVDIVPEMSQYPFTVRIFDIVNFISFYFGAYFFFSYLFDVFVNPISKAEKRSSLMGFVLVCVLHFVFFYFDIRYAGPVILFIFYTWLCTRSIVFAISTKKADFTFVCLMIIGICMLAIFLNETHDHYVGVYDGALYSSLLFFIIAVCYLTIYFRFVLIATLKSYREEAEAKKVRELQTNILKNQVSPHYLFNALNVIKTLYGESKDQGDIALDLLSRHLRAYTKAADTILVPLREELGVVSDFVELEGLKYAKEIEVIYDIESDDFPVPYFSLQPLVENALKYSKIMDKKDGCLTIRAYQDGDKNIIEVIDNGIGFEPTLRNKDSFGLKNVRERFEILLNANFEVMSKLGEGARIRIEYPIEKTNQMKGEDK